MNALEVVEAVGLSVFGAVAILAAWGAAVAAILWLLKKVEGE